MTSLAYHGLSQVLRDALSGRDSEQAARGLDDAVAATVRCADALDLLIRDPARRDALARHVLVAHLEASEAAGHRALAGATIVELTAAMDHLAELQRAAGRAPAGHGAVTLGTALLDSARLIDQAWCQIRRSRDHRFYAAAQIRLIERARKAHRATTATERDREVLDALLATIECSQRAMSAIATTSVRAALRLHGRHSLKEP